MYPLSPTYAATTLPIQVKEETTWRCPPQEVKYTLYAIEAKNQNTG